MYSVGTKFLQAGLPQLLSFSLLLVPIHAWPLDESRLWLPLKYKKYHFDLMVSAIAAEKDSSCAQVMEGTLDMSLSTPERPVFRILCRDAEAVSFNMAIDGKSRQILTTERRVEELLTDEQKVRRQARLAELARQKLAERKKALWNQCEAEVAEEARYMIDFAWIEVEAPEPVQLDEQSAVFERDFNARSPAGAELFFEAECMVVDGGPATVNIRGKSDIVR